MGIPRYWREQPWRYGLRVRYPEQMKNDINMNPALTIAQLVLLDHYDRYVVHSNMEAKEIRSGEKVVFP